MKKSKIMNYLLFLGIAIVLNIDFVFALSGECVVCGSSGIAIPIALPRFISGLVRLFQILVPVILIIVGMVDFIKAIISGDEKVFKDTTNSFIKKIIAGVFIFLIVAVVKLAFNIVGDEGKSSLACVSCFLDKDSCIEQACPARQENINGGTTVQKKHCSEFTYDECPGYDNYNVECKRADVTRKCRAAVVKNSCEDYTGAECPVYPNKSEIGDYCMRIDAGGSSSICIKDTSKKHCADYMGSSECPKTDDYGNKCTHETMSGTNLCY